MRMPSHEPAQRVSIGTARIDLVDDAALAHDRDAV